MTLRERLPHRPQDHLRGTGRQGVAAVFAAQADIAQCPECRRVREEDERLWCIVYGTGPLSREDVRALRRLLWGGRTC